MLCTRRLDTPPASTPGQRPMRAAQVRGALVSAERKVIELPGLTPSLAAYDALLGGEVAHVD